MSSSSLALSSISYVNPIDMRFCNNLLTWIFYYSEYSNNLQEDIYSETSGHFRDTLMNLVQVWRYKTITCTL